MLFCATKSFPISTVPVGHFLYIGSYGEMVLLSLLELYRPSSRFPSVQHDASRETEQSVARKNILIGEIL